MERLAQDNEPTIAAPGDRERELQEATLDYQEKRLAYDLSLRDVLYAADHEGGIGQDQTQEYQKVAQEYYQARSRYDAASAIVRLAQA